VSVSTVEQPKAVRSSGWTARRIVTDVVLTITTLLLIVAIFAIWANRQLLNPDNWSSTSTSLLQNEKVRDATANYLVDQLYANVDVSSLLSQRLPPALQPLAGPAAGALRNAALQGTELALSRPVVQNLWTTANRAADQALVAIINGGNRQVSVNGNEVTLNLGAILNDVASQLGISADIGAKLPPSVANLVIIKANQLKLIQDLGGALKGLAVVLYILVPLLYIVAMVIARARRRKTLMAIGWSGIVAGLVVLLARSLTIKAAANTLTHDGSVRPAVRAVASIATGMLSDIASAVILIGVVLVVTAWFAGPSRFAVPVRRWLAPYLEANPVATYGVVVAVLLLVFIWQPIPATGTPVGMIVFTVLALIGTEALRREARAEFGTRPPALAGSPPVAPGPGPPSAPMAGSAPPTPAEAPAADQGAAPREPSAP
jgi:hypothetical protein